MVCKIKAVAAVVDPAVGPHPAVRRHRQQRIGGEDPAGPWFVKSLDPHHAGTADPARYDARQTPLYMHGKQVIADGVEAFVGSENLTNTSLIQNRELGTFFTDPAMIARLQSVFESDFMTPNSSLSATACTDGEPDCYTIWCPPVP